MKREDWLYYRERAMHFDSVGIAWAFEFFCREMNRKLNERDHRRALDMIFQSRDAISTLIKFTDAKFKVNVLTHGNLIIKVF